MIFGVDYYPEHWNRDEWESQAKLMQEGANYIKIKCFLKKHKI